MKRIRIHEHKKCFNKRLDKKWDWSVPVWLTPNGIFADCVIVSRSGKLFDTQEEAEKDMNKVLKIFGVI